jgi:UDP-N-acetylmuramoylalanine--D-glutamate ligase
VRLVFGLGRSGLGVLRYLAAKGLPARFFDEQPQPAEIDEALRLGFLPADPKEFYQEVIAAPGIPLTHPLLQRLRTQGADIFGEAELAYRHSSTPIVGITGTAGKSTTTVLTAHFLRALGFQAQEGGNLDPPLVSIIDQAEVAVAELSSFQLERVVRFRPRVAVLLNLGVDHLDRHGSVEAYHQAKLNLIRHLQPEDALVYNQADPAILKGIEGSPARRFPFTPGSPWESNLRAALEAARAFALLQGRSVDPGHLEAAIATAPRLPGRFEPFARKGSLVFIDDSIATRLNAVEAALKAAPPPVGWILGGVDKGAPLEPLIPLVRERVGLILALGRDGPRMAEVFAPWVEVLLLPPQGAEALHMAIEEALKRPLRSLLLAPLAASFDQFRDYKERSTLFRQAALAAGAEPSEALWTPS